MNDVSTVAAQHQLLESVCMVLRGKHFDDDYLPRILTLLHTHKVTSHEEIFPEKHCHIILMFVQFYFHSTIAHQRTKK